MLSHEIQAKLLALPSPLIAHSLLFFDSWTDPEDFYTMGVKKRMALRQQYIKHAKPPTQDNIWVWFGAYSDRSQPKINNFSVPSFLYQIFIKPTNNSRLRGVLNASRSDVNPYKYMNSMQNSKLEIAKYRATLSGTTISEVLPDGANAKFEALIAAALEDVKLYYYDGATVDDLKTMLIHMNHPPLAIDEAIKRSGKFS